MGIHSSDDDGGYLVDYELRKAQSEIKRHHQDFEKISQLAEQAASQLRNFEGDDPNLVVGSVETFIRDIRNIVG